MRRCTTVRLLPSMTVADAARAAAEHGCELHAAWNGSRCVVELVQVDDVPAFLRRVQPEPIDAGPYERDRRLAHEAGVPLHGEIP